MTCAECKFWQPPKRGAVHGVCSRIVDPERKNAYSAEEVEADDKKRAASVACLFASEFAELCTLPSFGCTLFEAKTP